MATITSAASGAWSAGATWVGGVKPADGDTVVIAAGHSVLMDDDTSAYATGISGLTIQGAAVTPAMLYFTDGTSGYLKMTSAMSIVGTAGTLKGRLLANSDGVWGNTGNLAFAFKAVIEIIGTGTINAQYLDSALYCAQPVNKYVSTYGVMATVASVDTAANTLTITSMPAPFTANGTAVMLRSTGALPSPLRADTVYYVTGRSGDTLKLTGAVSSPIIDLTSAGSGTIEIYSGHSNTATAVINVLTDLTSDSAWTTADNHDAVALVDSGYGTVDKQNSTLAAIASGTITLGNNVDSSQFPGARLFLISRNVRIFRNIGSSTTKLIDYGSAAAAGGVFQCELSMPIGSYGAGIASGTGHIISGVVAGGNYPVNGGADLQISGIVLGGGSYGVQSIVGGVVSGIIAGSTYGLASCQNVSVTGELFGNTNGTYVGLGAIISGLIVGGTGGMVGGENHQLTADGKIFGCTNGLSAAGRNLILKGEIFNCQTGILLMVGGVLEGSIHDCETGIEAAHDLVITGAVYRNTLAVSNTAATLTIMGAIGFEPDGTESLNTTDFSLPTAGYQRVLLKSAKIPASPVIANRNSSASYGSQCHSGLFSEDHNRVVGAYIAYLPMGNIIKTPCDGTGAAPSIDPLGGTGHCIEASSIQSYCGPRAPLNLFNKHRLWMTAAAHTITYKVQTDYAGIAAGGLLLTAEYLGTGNVRTVATSAPTIATRTDDTDWTQTIAVTFTPATEGWVDLSLDLMEYEAGKVVYVWPTPAVS